LSVRCRIVVLVGLPGSGKSTWIDENRLPALSSDKIRHLLSDDEENQNVNRLVFNTMRYLLRQRLAAGAQTTYIDSTNLSLWERRSWIRFAEQHDCDVEAVYFDTPLETCLTRNAARARKVPPEVVQTMARRLVAPSLAEGFSKVKVVKSR
jgi:predicted kinase